MSEDSRTPTEIKYLTGDATQPVGDGQKIITHVVNSVGGWGAGFVLAISRRWGDPEFAYRTWHHRGKDKEAGTFTLGRVQFVPVGDDLQVANMVAQLGYGSFGTAKHKADADPTFKIPLRYDALQECLTRVADLAVLTGASVHMPRIGCGLAGGKWEMVEPIIIETLCRRGVQVTVYDLK